MGRLQERGMHTEHHNVLYREVLHSLYYSPYLSQKNLRGFQNRINFTVGILTAVRPKAMNHLKMSQFAKVRMISEDVWRIKASVGAGDGSSKTASDGWSVIGYNPSEVFVWNETYGDGSINVFEEIDSYMNLRQTISSKIDKCFWVLTEISLLQQNVLRPSHLE